MYLKRLFVLIGVCLVFNSLQAIMMDYMIPLGYQSPFLKSGQYVTSLYYYSYNNENESASETLPYMVNHGEYSVNFLGYLGLTDYITLSTRLGIYPE